MIGSGAFAIERLAQAAMTAASKSELAALERDLIALERVRIGQSFLAWCIYALAPQGLVPAAQVVDPAEILDAMSRGVDPTSEPTDGLGQARAALEAAEAAFVEADRNLKSGTA